MHCGSKRKRCPSLEHIDLQHQQHTLFDLSILKLQQEHLRHGVEPRLLRFVLINNALRTLQNHTNSFEDDNLVFECSEQDSEAMCSNQFLCNTFKHGGLSLTPVTPPTPAKVPRLDSPFPDQSPLVASTPFQGGLLDDISEFGEASVNAAGVGSSPVVVQGACAASEPSNTKRATSSAVNSLAVVNQSCSSSNTSNVCLGKRKTVDSTSGESSSAVEDIVSNSRVHPCVGGEGCEDGDHCTDGGGRKKLCLSDDRSKPSTLHINGFRLATSTSLYPTSSSSSSTTITTVSSSIESSPAPSSFTATLSSTTLTASTPSTHHHHHQQHDSSEDDEYPSTPSPIDFTKVDPTIYDFDTRTTLVLPGGLNAAQQEGPLLNSTASSVVAPSSTSLSSPSLEKPPVSCSMEAILSAQNGDVMELNTHSRRLLATSESLPGALSNGILPSPTADVAEPDFLEDLEHIVSLLMT